MGRWDRDNNEISNEEFNRITEKMIKVQTLKSIDDMYKSHLNHDQRREYVFQLLKNELLRAKDDTEYRLKVIDRFITFVNLK